MFFIWFLLFCSNMVFICATFVAKVVLGPHVPAVKGLTFRQKVDMEWGDIACFLLIVLTFPFSLIFFGGCLEGVFKRMRQRARNLGLGLLVALVYKVYAAGGIGPMHWAMKLLSLVDVVAAGLMFLWYVPPVEKKKEEKK